MIDDVAHTLSLSYLLPVSFIFFSHGKMQVHRCPTTLIDEDHRRRRSGAKGDGAADLADVATADVDRARRATEPRASQTWRRRAAQRTAWHGAGELSGGRWMVRRCCRRAHRRQRQTMHEGRCRSGSVPCAAAVWAWRRLWHGGGAGTDGRRGTGELTDSVGIGGRRGTGVLTGGRRGGGAGELTGGRRGQAHGRTVSVARLISDGGCLHSFFCSSLSDLP
jgi:hypothetical protein